MTAGNRFGANKFVREMAKAACFMNPRRYTYADGVEKTCTVELKLEREIREGMGTDPDVRSREPCWSCRARELLQ